MIQLIASDIDGTLLPYGAPLPPANRDALVQAQALGVRIVLATVRKRKTTALIADELGLPCTFICQAGATIYDETGTQLRNLSIPFEIALAIAELARAHDFALLATIDEVNYHAIGSQPGAFEPAAGERIADLVEMLHRTERPPTRLMVRGEAAVTLMMQHFADAPIRFMRHYAPDGTLYDAAITAVEATKESALALLCERWGIPMSDVLALGDAEADIAMLRMAGIGVALGDAHPEVRAAADWVAPPAADAGVAAAIQRFVLTPHAAKAGA